MGNVIGDKIKELRIKKRLMQSDLANQLSVSNSTISHWEKGRRLPSLSELQRIADFFHVDLNYFNTHRDFDVSIQQRESTDASITIDHHQIGFRLNRLSLALYSAGNVTVLVALLVHEYWDVVHVVAGMILTMIAIMLFLISGFKQWSKFGKRLIVSTTDRIVYNYKKSSSNLPFGRNFSLIWLSISASLTIMSYTLIAT
jgi:transcriptional regulator with XRE-family HTH domain